jgi:hypothetical protein
MIVRWTQAIIVDLRLHGIVLDFGELSHLYKFNVFIYL